MIYPFLVRIFIKKKKKKKKKKKMVVVVEKKIKTNWIPPALRVPQMSNDTTRHDMNLRERPMKRKRREAGSWWRNNLTLPPPLVKEKGKGEKSY